MKIGRYDILEVIGQGAMGTVYRALDPLIDRTVAIKTVPIARLKEEGPEFEARFMREAQSAGRLSHPNIVTIYDVGETEDLAYIAMEYLSGTTLRDIMDKGRIPLDLVMTTALQIAEALAYAHEHGVVHRDIKPSNIVITLPHGQVKLTDFGIAHLVNSERTHTGLMLGSPRYMSPEQAMGREINGRSDIFSLGAVLYEMVTGKYAFDGQSLPSILYRVINETPASPLALRPGVSVLLEKTIVRMMNKQADARLDSHTLAEELRKANVYAVPVAPRVGENRVPPFLPAMAFGTPFAVLILIALGMIVINYFLALPLKDAKYQAEIALGQIAAVDKIRKSRVDQALRNLLAQPPLDRPLERQPKEAASPAKAPTRDPYLVGLENKRVELEIKKTDLLLRYTEHHPDVVLIKRQLKKLEAERTSYIRKQKSEARK